MSRSLLTYCALFSFIIWRFSRILTIETHAITIFSTGSHLVVHVKSNTGKPNAYERQADGIMTYLHIPSPSSAPLLRQPVKIAKVSTLKE